MFSPYLLLINFYNSAFSLARSSEVEGCRSNDMSASRPTVEVPEDIPEGSSPYLRFKHEYNSQESCDVSYVQCERPAALSRILYHRFFSPHSAHLSASDTISDMHCPGRAASAWQDVHSQEAGAILELDWPLYQRWGTPKLRAVSGKWRSTRARDPPAFLWSIQPLALPWLLGTWWS